MTETEKAVYEFIRDTFEIGDDPEFTVDVNIFDNGFVDSMGATEILRFLEENWGIEITQGDLIMCPMNSIEEIAAIVDSKL